MTTVKARLQGHEFDLDTLKQLFSGGDPLVDRDDQGYYLSSSRLDGLFEDAPEMSRTAGALLTRVNGVGRVHEADFRPVQLSGTYTDGVRRTHLALLGRVVERDRARPIVGATDSERPEPATAPPIGAQYVVLADGDEDVADALDLLGAPLVAIGWAELWKVFEIVRESVGNQATLAEQGWVKPREIRAFTASANLPAVSGKGARHARLSGQPKKTMSIQVGREFARRLVRGWVAATWRQKHT